MEQEQMAVEDIEYIDSGERSYGQNIHTTFIKTEDGEVIGENTWEIIDGGNGQLAYILAYTNYYEDKD